MKLKYKKIAEEWLDAQSQEYFYISSPDSLIKDFANYLTQRQRAKERRV